MMKSVFTKCALGALAVMTAATPVMAQYGGQPPAPPPPAYDYDRPPPGYDGSQTPPPPPGYQPAPNAQQMAEQDRYYADRAQRWAEENCVKSGGNGAGGAILGGLLGAIIGHGVGSRGDKGTATVAGAVIGGVGGAAIASNSGRQTSPGCPPGYVVRRGAPAYYYERDYVYAAPGWYRPWAFYGGRWIYRPYPYHDFYARRYPGYGHPEWHDRGWHDHEGRGHERRGW